MVSEDVTTYSCWKAISVFMQRKNSGWYGYPDGETKMFLMSADIRNRSIRINWERKWLLQDFLD